jgi:hypothetical protein
MASKYFKAFNFLKKKGTVAPTITQPRQLPGTMKKIRSQYEKFGFKKAKTATDRANIVRNKKSIERMEKLDKAKAKRKEGIKGSKEVKKMVDTGQATRIGGQVFHKSVREKKFMGGVMGGVIDKFKKKSQTAKDPVTKIKDTVKTARPDNKGQKLTPDQSKKVKKGIKEKIMPTKKKKRLEELRKQLEGMKKGGPVDKKKKKFPDLTGDGKVTQADILKGRGVFRKGGASK